MELDGILSDGDERRAGKQLEQESRTLEPIPHVSLGMTGRGSCGNEKPT